MKTIFCFQVQIDTKEKKLNVVLGCEDKKNFDPEALKLIETCCTDLAQMIATAYTNEHLNFTKKKKVRSKHSV